MSNPYVSRGPLNDPGMFYGRVHELHEIASFVRGNQSVSIVGPRKIGKTSLLLHLMRAETRDAVCIGEENLLVYQDCGALSNSSDKEMLSQFCVEMAAALRTHDLDPEPALKEAVAAPTRIAFEAALRKLDQRGLRMVLMLDEFEQMALNPQLEVNFFNALRSAAGRHQLVFLTASARPLIELTYAEKAQNILSSPFFNIFAPLFLGLLAEEDARALIRRPMEAAGISINTRLENFIYRLAGGHPLALQIACFHSWGNPDDLMQIEHRTLQELDSHFQYYWQNLNSTEREVLCNLSQSVLQEAVDPAIRVALRDLTWKCLLIQEHRSYRYPSKAWEEFVAAREPQSKGGQGGNSQLHPPDREDNIEVSRAQNIQHDGPGRFNSLFGKLLRESLPEMIGGLVVALIGAVVWLINSWFGLQVTIVAVIGALSIGLVLIWLISKRKRSKVQIGESGSLNSSNTKPDHRM